jgi:hypothetical protein
MPRHPALPGPPLRWWQARPLAGLVVGWLAIGVLVWQFWTAFNGLA